MCDAPGSEDLEKAWPSIRLLPWDVIGGRMAISSAMVAHITLPQAIRAPIVSDSGLVLLDLALEPIAFDEGAVALLSSPSQFNGKEPQIHIPKKILKAIRDCKRTELATIKLRFWAQESEYTCRVYLIPENQGLRQSLLALHFERGVSAYEAVRKLALIYGLTDRQHEALLGIATGLSNKEMAQRMAISPNTVKVYLRLIMAKMGATSRAEVAAKLLDVTGDDRSGSAPVRRSLATRA
jgi:DNA-binding CsgD family transcriptional regulator